MRKRYIFIMLAMIMGLLAACGDNSADNDDANELKSLDVDFPLPEAADVGEEVTLEANVTYGGEVVEDADEMEFEYWLKGDKDNSTMVEADNNEDGSYTKTVTFDEDGIYEVYAHTTAREMHTMPKKAIKVGNVEEDLNAEEEEHEHEHIDGFSMEFTEPDDVTVDEATELKETIELDEAPLEDANVRFEIWQDDNEKHEWVDASESSEGVYTADYAFPEEGTYNIQIHVKDDDDLHEHEVVTVEATK